MLRPWKVSLGDRIDASRPTPLYMQIVHALIHEIRCGRLPPDSFLPSSRELAEALGVNRKTVVLAYDDLIAQGWLEPSATRGTRVSRLLQQRDAAARHAPMRASHIPGAPAYPFHPPPERPLALPNGPWLKLDEGSPDGRLFPHEILARAYRNAVQRAARDNRLLYQDPRGSPVLRESVAEMLRSSRGLAVTADNICITRGSQNGIYLAARTLARPGDAFIVEALTYEPAVAAFEACGGTVVPVALDRDGIDPDAVERACRRNRVRAIFLTPHHQFPTTISLRPERRLRLLELSCQFGFAIIEDDYDHEFHFESQPLLPMASYAPERVIYVGSLSKLLLPALRVGYIAAPAALIDALAHGISVTEGMGNTLTEDAAAELINNGEVRRHARKVTRIYAARRLSFAATLREQLTDRVEFRMPDGGLAFWLTFPAAGDLDRIERASSSMKLRFAPSHSFATTPDAQRGLRIGFASLEESEARLAIGLLASALAAQPLDV